MSVVTLWGARWSNVSDGKKKGTISTTLAGKLRIFTVLWNLFYAMKIMAYHTRYTPVSGFLTFYNVRPISEQKKDIDSFQKP